MQRHLVIAEANGTIKPEEADTLSYGWLRGTFQSEWMEDRL
jgi:hypothetical protein